MVSLHFNQHFGFT